MTTVLDLGDYIIIALMIVFFGSTRYMRGRPDVHNAQIERKLDAIIKHLDVGLPPISMPGALSPEVRRLVSEGHQLEAIKAYRAETGAGLKEAKTAVDDYRRQNGPVVTS